MDPCHARVGVVLDDRQTGAGTVVVGGDAEAVGKSALDHVAGHVRPPFGYSNDARPRPKWAHRARSLSWAGGLRAFHRQLGRLIPAPDPELAEDRGDVMAHGLLRDEESRGDLRVGQGFGNEVEHFGLPNGEAPWV